MTKRNILTIIGIFIIVSASAQKAFRLKNVVNNRAYAGAALPIKVAQMPTGTFIDKDKVTANSNNEPDQPVLISDFYISESEVTNAQYREFIAWVRDSISARRLGGEYIELSGLDTIVNWKKASKINYNDPAIATQLGDLMLDPSRTIGQQRGVDPQKMIYLLEGFNYQEAVKKENKGKNPNEFVYRYEVEVYPDTLCWMRDFGYSNNEQMAVSYFSSAKYQNHPVVGVSWKQANAFCDWMTRHKIYTLQTKNKLSVGGKCRLPTETEWAYAARLNFEEPKEEKSSGKKKAKSQTNDDSIIVFSQEKIFPVYVNESKKGKAGLYNMADNVSEWTNTSYYEGGDNFTNRFNPDIQWGAPGSESKAMRRKVIRGGSWKDTPKFITTSNRTYEDMDISHSYLGFRVVVNLPEQY